jgi:hypothetical protein
MIRFIAAVALATALLIPGSTSAHTGHLWIEDGVWIHPALHGVTLKVWVGGVKDQLLKKSTLRAINLWDKAEGVYVLRTYDYWAANARVHTYWADDSNDGITYLFPDGVADVYLNLRNISGQDEINMVTCHELGHAFGLTHNFRGNSCLGYDRWITKPSLHDLNLLKLLKHH